MTRLSLAKFVRYSGLIFLAGVVFADASELDDSRKLFQTKLLAIDEGAQSEKKILQKNYSDALLRLIQKYQEAGDLEAVLAIQNEKKQIESGSVPVKPAAFEELGGMRKVFLDLTAKIDVGRNQKRNELIEAFKVYLEKMVVQLTKEAKLDEAIALKEEIKGMASIPSTVAGSAKPVTEIANPVAGDKIIPVIEFPKDRPDDASDPFGETRWIESRTVPRGDYRIKETFKIGAHGKNNVFYFASGGSYTHHSGKLHLWGGRIFGEDCRFKDIPFRADHTGRVYFRNCWFDDSSFREEGAWYGYGNYDSQWYFENCRLKGGSFGGSFNINYFGLNMNRCSVERVELPGIHYRKHEPASRRKDKWLTVDRCLFVKCKVPLSFLLITTNCAFVDCRFEDDTVVNEFKEPVEVIYYAEDSTNAIRKAPDIVTMIEKPYSDLNLSVGSILPEE